MRTRFPLVVSVVLSTLTLPAPTRGEHTWAVLPPGSGGPEGLEVAPDGTVYVGSFGFDADRPLTGQGRIFVFGPNGRLIRQVTVEGSTANLLGLRWHERIPRSGELLDDDRGRGR